MTVQLLPAVSIPEFQVPAFNVPAVNTWNEFYSEKLLESIQATLQMVLLTLCIGGSLGLVFGIVLFSTRPGGIYRNLPVYWTLNFLINLIRPIPFIIFIAAVRPATLAVMGGTLGLKGAVFPMVVMCSMATARIVEQSLVGSDPGIIEAGRAMGASRLHVLIRIVVPEVLAPLILGYTFLFVGIVDMSAMAGAIGSGGLGDFALTYGYKKFNDYATWSALLIIIVLVQVVQQIGNVLARKVLHR
jgi:D-methionine transport system permease protein